MTQRATPTESRQSMIDINSAARLQYALGIAGVPCSAEDIANLIDNSVAPGIDGGGCYYASANTDFACSTTLVAIRLDVRMKPRR
eukprot:m.241843 g.241843  ORF g.241843 m.241843 type:complete len:85 (-) comp54431_c3_seq9:170-424(-)